MESDEQQQQEKLQSITHSPYYGCTVRVVSKANVAYEGVLDGISASKDRIFLKNVRVDANLAGSPRQSNWKREKNIANSHPLSLSLSLSLSI